MTLSCRLGMALVGLAVVACSPAYTEEEFLRARLACQSYFDCFDAALPATSRSDGVRVGYTSQYDSNGPQGGQWARIDAEPFVLSFLEEQCGEQRLDLNLSFPGNVSCQGPGGAVRPEWQDHVLAGSVDPYRYPRAVCEEYLDCVRDVTPEAAPAAVQSFGPGSTCWQSDDEAYLCEMGCRAIRNELSDLYPGHCDGEQDADVCSHRDTSETCEACCFALGASGAGSGNVSPENRLSAAASFEMSLRARCFLPPDRASPVLEPGGSSRHRAAVITGVPA